MKYEVGLICEHGNSRDEGYVMLVVHGQEVEEEHTYGTLYANGVYMGNYKDLLSVIQDEIQRMDIELTADYYLNVGKPGSREVDFNKLINEDRENIACRKLPTPDKCGYSDVEYVFEEIVKTLDK